MAAAARIAAEEKGGGAPRGGRPAGSTGEGRSSSQEGGSSEWCRKGGGEAEEGEAEEGEGFAPSGGVTMAGERNWATPFGSAPPKSAGARQGSPPPPQVAFGSGKPKERSRNVRSGSRPARAILTSSSFFREPATYRRLTD